MARCAYCDQLILLGGVNVGGAAFCNERCAAQLQSVLASPDFCPTCIGTTGPDSSGGTFALNGIGTRLYGSADPCATCGSVVQTLWFCILWVPLLPLGKYRVKYLSPTRFISRRLLANPPAALTSTATTVTIDSTRVEEARVRAVQLQAEGKSEEEIAKVLTEEFPPPAGAR